MFDEHAFRIFMQEFDEKRRLKVATVYAAGMRKHIGLCEQAVADQDASGLQDSLHDVKSLAYMIGAEDLGLLAKTIEQNIIDKHQPEAMDMAPNLFPLMHQVIDVIDACIESGL